MNTNNNSEFIYNTIKKMILSGEIEEKEKINQVVLSKQLGVSRTPVVKALYRLTSEGLIENIPNKGFFVNSFTIGELIDLLKIRQAFDRVLAENLINTITSAEILEMENIFKDFIDCKWTEKQINKYWDADKQFHEYLIELCSNKWVKKINDTFQIYGRVYRGGLVRKPEQTLPEHLSIINAIKEKNLELTAIQLNKHIQSSIDVLEHTVKTLGNFGYSNKIN